MSTDLIPVLSYVWLRGACRYCGERISSLHPTIELAATAIAIWAILADPANAWITCAVGWVLLTLAWIDWTDLLLLDALTLPLLVAGLLVTWFQAPDFLFDRAVAAVGAYIALEGIAAGYRKLRGREGLGGGDSKLIAAAGAWCGVAALPFIVLCSAVLGLLLALVLALLARPMTFATRIPFGPCIALAFWLGRLYGDPLGFGNF